MQLLWALWAAKEAAFKAVSRDDPTVCSIPRRYPVELDGGDGLCRLVLGRVLSPRGELALRVTITDDYVHALAARTEAAFNRILARVDRREGTGDSDDPSAFVRTSLIREMVGRLCCPVTEIEIRQDLAGPAVPRVYHRGLPLADEISLSHDGRFTAFAWNPAE